MPLKEKLYKLFAIHKNESRRVAFLITIQFFSGIALSLIAVATSAKFIQSLEIKDLYWVCLIAGSSIIIASKLFKFLERVFSIGKVYLSTIYISSMVVLLFYFLIITYDYPWQVILLFAGNYTLFFMNSIGYWGIASQLFNVRDSKRLFPVISSGDLLSKILGYVLAGALASRIHLESLLLVGVILYFIAGFVLYFFLKENKVLLLKYKTFETAEPIHHSVNTYKLEKKLILSICMLAFVFSFIFNLNDYFFYSEIKGSDNYSQGLAQFLAIVFASGRVLALLYKMILSAKIQQALGLKKNLLLLPAVTILFCGTYLLAGQYFGQTELYYIAAYMVLFEMIKSSTYEPYYYALFQPIRAEYRLRGHGIASGMVEPLGMIFTGITIWMISSFPTIISIISVAVILLLAALVWMIIIGYIEKEYYKFMQKSMTKNSCFSDSPLSIIDNQYIINYMIQVIRDEQEKNSLVAAQYLYMIDINRFRRLFTQLLPGYKLNEVVCFVIQKAGENKWRFFIPLVKGLDVKKNMRLNMEVTHFLCQFETEKFFSFLNDMEIRNNEVLLESCIMGGLANEDKEVIATCYSLIKNMLNEKSKTKQLRALKLIALSKDRNLYPLIVPLFNSTDPDIKSQLLTTLNAINNPYCIPFLFYHLDDSKYHQQAVDALINFAEIWAPHISPLHSLNYKLLLTILARSNSDIATDYLMEIFYNDTDYHEIILPFMVKKRHLAVKEAFVIKQIEGQLVKLGSINKLVLHSKEQQITNALEIEQTNVLLMIIYYLYLLTEQNKLFDLIRVIKHKQHQHYIPLVETIEFYFMRFKLSKSIKPIEQALLHDVLVLDEKPLNLPEEILTEKGFNYSPWTVAVVLYLYPEYKKLVSAYDEKIIAELL